MGTLRGPSMDASPSDWNPPSSIMLGSMVKYFFVVSRISLSLIRNLVLCLLRLYVGSVFLTCWCLCFSWFGVLPASPRLMSADQCVLLARSAARAERTETLKETKTLTKRRLFLVINCCSVFCLAVYVLSFFN